MARQNYEPINDTAGVSFGSSGGGGQEEYGGPPRSYQSAEIDAENPFDVRVVHHRGEDSSRRQFLWWVLAPAITLLLVIAVAVAMASQTSVPLPSSPGSVMPALGSAGPLTGPGATGALPPTYAMAQGDKTGATPLTTAVVGDDDDSTPPPAPQKPAPGMNATTVLSCLEDKCEPFVTQLGKSWRELANINLLRCLTSSAFNKTAAATCFKSAGPSELRDNLVACAGCNKCVKLKDQANVDQACAKYKAWAAKKAAEADDATATPASPADDDTTSSAPAMEKATGPPASDSLAAGLPKSLRESFCSEYWCP